MLEKLIEIQTALVKGVENRTYQRYLFHKINWENRLIGIVGARGVGKTTLLLQYYRTHFKSPEDCLYFSADHIYVTSHGLYPLAETFFNLGGKVLLIDEIHKYPNWQVELKNIYDSFPGKKIIFSGSASIHLLKGKADLSRRAVFHELKGLSLREFLALTKGITFKALSLNTLLKDHLSVAQDIQHQLPILRHFKEYLKFGYYPFFQEGTDTFFERLGNVVEKILYEDIPSLYPIRATTLPSLKKLFHLVATSQPFTPNISQISSQLGISKEYIYTYLEELQKAGLFSSLYAREKGYKLSRKPEKIYLENTNLFHLVEAGKGFPIEKGSIRETFFVSQVMAVQPLYYSEQADFVDSQGKIFEVGGKSKKPHTYPPETIFAIDDLTIGFKNQIPLWLFGFLY